MHIEFRLPSSAGGQAAHYSCTELNQRLAEWQSMYGYTYTTEITYYKLTLRFDDDRAYTWFALCGPWMGLRWQICED